MHARQPATACPPTRPPLHLRLRLDPADPGGLSHSLRVLERWLRRHLAALAHDPALSAQDEVDAEQQAEVLGAVIRALRMAADRRSRAELAAALGIELARLRDPRALH